MKLPGNPFKKRDVAGSAPRVTVNVSLPPQSAARPGGPAVISHVKITNTPTVSRAFPHKPAKLGQTIGATTAHSVFSIPATAVSSFPMGASVGTAFYGLNDPNETMFTVDTRTTLIDDKGGVLPCYGCAHSAASEPFPSMPSGERPCGFCVRNTEVREWKRKDPKPATWYDGSRPLALNSEGLQDNYVSTDRLREDIERTTPINAKDQGAEERMVSLWRKASQE